MSDVAWIDGALRGARPQAMAALVRHFGDVDLAEEAFQEASLRALKAWPTNGPPRDPVAWLLFVGRNAALDGMRKRRKERELPPEEALSDIEDAEAPLAERLDDAHYRDDILRLLFLCCHPELPATQQLALALRIVCGLSVNEIAHAFLVAPGAMEQRITRAKRAIAAADVPFEAPGPVERAERVGVIAAALYLLFNEGYSATGGEALVRAPLCDEAIRLARLLVHLYPGEPEILGLTALMLLQHARTSARLDADGAIVLLEDQDRRLWDRDRIAEGLAMVDKALRHRRPGPYQVQAAIAALHARAETPEETDWEEIELLYETLERMQPSPVVTLNRAVAVSKARGAAAALELVEPLAKDLGGYFYFFGVRGALLLELGRDAEARVAFDRALALARTPAEAAHIRTQIDRLQKVSRPGAAPSSSTHEGVLHVRSQSRIHERLAKHVQAGTLPGLVTLVSRRGQVTVDAIGAQAFGASGPMQRDAIFRITSMTKPVTATAAMILVEGGTLRLDDPIDGLLPELAGRRVLRRLDGPLDDTVPAVRAITLRDLLTFRMGFGVVWGPPNATPIQRAAEELKLGAFGPPRPQEPPAPDEWMRRFATLPLMHQPGEAWAYNTSAEVLGVLIARAARTPLDAFFRERIFEPLGMRDTDFSVPAAKIHRLPLSYWATNPMDPDASGTGVYDGAADGRWARSPAFPSGGAGLVSTIDDYFAFARMLFDGGAKGGVQILSKESVRAMTSDQLTPQQKARSPVQPQGYWSNHGWGYGVAIATGARDPAGPGGYGWNGGLGTSWCNDSDEGVIAILMTQRAAFPGMSGVYRDFWSAVYEGE